MYINKKIVILKLFNIIDYIKSKNENYTSYIPEQKKRIDIKVDGLVWFGLLDFMAYQPLKVI